MNYILNILLNPFKFFSIIFIIILFILSLKKIKINLILLYLFISINSLLSNIINYKIIIIIILLLLMLLFLKIIKNKFIFIKNKLDKYIFIYFILNLIYFILSYLGIKGIKNLISLSYFLYNIMPIFFYFLIKNLLIYNKIDLKYIINIIILMLNLIFFLNLIIYFKFTDYSSGILRRFGIQVLGVHPNNYGALYVAIFIYYYYLIKNKKNIYNYIFLFNLFIAIIMSESRAAFVALIIVLFLYYYKEKNKYKGFIYLILSVILIIYFLKDLQLFIFERLYEGYEGYIKGNYYIASSGRLGLWLGVYYYILSNNILNFIFGGGLFDYQIKSYKFVNQDFVSYAHNQYLTILTDMGLFGLVIFFLLIFYIFKYTKILYIKHNILGKATYYLMVTFLITCLFGYRFGGKIMYFIWPLISIISININKK